VSLVEVLALGLLDAASAELIAVESLDGMEQLKAQADPELARLADEHGLTWAAIQIARREYANLPAGGEGVADD